MSNFQFLTPEFKPLFEPAVGAETVPRALPLIPRPTLLMGA